MDCHFFKVKLTLVNFILLHVCGVPNQGKFHYLMTSLCLFEHQLARQM